MQASGGSTRRFWLNKRLPLKAHEWYLRWAKTFEKALPNKPLNERTIEDVQTYIELLVKRNRYQDWQLQSSSPGCGFKL